MAILSSINQSINQFIWCHSTEAHATVRLCRIKEKCLETDLKCVNGWSSCLPTDLLAMFVETSPHTGFYLSVKPGAQPRLKSWGDQGLGPNTAALAGVGCGRGSPPPAVRVRGYQLRKIFENSDTKSCILVTTCCEISCFLKTTAKKLEDQYIVGPQLKSWGDHIAPMCETIFQYLTLTMKRYHI